MANKISRLLVMNGQKIYQENVEGSWKNISVTKAKNIKPGIYNLSSASLADQKKIHTGAVVHQDEDNLFQESQGKLVTHRVADLTNKPSVGENVEIRYDNQGKASVLKREQIKKRKLTPA